MALVRIKQADQPKAAIKKTFFTCIDKSMQNDQDRRRGWSGRLSPSKPMTFDGCIVKFVKDHILSEPMNPSGQKIVNRGSAIHEKYEYFGKYYADEDDDYPVNVPIHCLKSYRNRRPEIPIDARDLLWKGFVDRLINVDGEPVVVDYKSNYQRMNKWRDTYIRREAQEKHVVQVNIYRYLLNRYKYTDVPIERFQIAYENVACCVPGDKVSRVVVNGLCEPYHEYTENIVLSASELVHYYFDGNKRMLMPCNGKYCKKHGTKTVKKLPFIGNR